MCSAGLSRAGLTARDNTVVQLTLAESMKEDRDVRGADLGGAICGIVPCSRPTVGKLHSTRYGGVPPGSVTESSVPMFTSTAGGSARAEAASVGFTLIRALDVTTVCMVSRTVTFTSWVPSSEKLCSTPGS